MEENTMNMKNANRIINWFKVNAPTGAAYATVRQEPYMRLVIERQGHELWVGYWYSLNGDQVPDPVVIVNTKNHTSRVCTIGGAFVDNDYCDEFLHLIHGRLSLLGESDEVEWK
jgi:hypothetical protein